MDVADNSQVLAATDQNGVEELPGFAGSDLDEMSLSYLTSISAFTSRVVWPSATAQGALLTSFQLGPRNFFTSQITATVFHQHLSPITYFSSLFALYRGSIKMTIKIVKTEFHTGRLAVCFQPFERSSGFSVPMTLANSAYSHREIVDIRYGNEFTLEFPYMSTSAYRSTAGDDAAYGIVSIFVLNTLESPPNVPADVPMLFEFSAGKDFELAEPCDMSGTPTQIYTPQSGKNVCEIVSEQIGNAHTTETLAPARLCIGEKITSIRQLLKRYSPLFDGRLAQSSQIYNFIIPYQIDVSYLEALVSTVADTTPDTYALTAPCFALLRGGLRIKVIPQTSENLRASTFLQPLMFQTILPIRSVIWSSTSSAVVSNVNGAQKPTAYMSNEVSGAVEVQVPFYHRYPSVAVCDLLSNNDNGGLALRYVLFGPTPRNVIQTKFSAIPAVKPVVYRAISEDFSLGMFVSTVPLSGWSAAYVG